MDSIFEIEKMMAAKNRLLQDLDIAKKSPNSQEVKVLANQAAEYEARIAEVLINAGYGEQSVVNLTSQASCLIDAGQLEESIAVYNKALNYCKSEVLRQWIKQEIQITTKQITL